MSDRIWDFAAVSNGMWNVRGLPKSETTLLGTADGRCSRFTSCGYTNARATLKYNDGAGSSYSEGDNMDGFRLGAGVQYQPNRIGARIEYRYSDYGKYSYQGFATDVSARRH